MVRGVTARREHGKYGGTRRPERHTMKLYVAGPMRGMPQYNRAAFEANAYVLRQAGYDVVTPIEVDRRVDPAFDHAIHVATPKQIARFQAESMAELARCDGVALLPGWRG